MQSQTESFDLAIKLSPRITTQQIGLLNLVFKERFFEIFDFKTRSAYIIFLRFNSVGVLLKEAERLRIQKPKKTEDPSGAEANRFMKLNKLLHKQQKKSLDSIDPRIRLYENFETLSQKTVHRFVPECPREIEDFDSISTKLQQNIIQVFTAAELLRIKYALLKKQRLFDLNIIDFLNRQMLLIGIYPLYETEKEEKKGDFGNYFGEKVGLYFEFLGHYIKWLFFPALAGLANMVCHSVLHHSAPSQIIADFAYSFIITVWFTIFLIFWQRKQSEINIQNGSYGRVFLAADKNPNFKATQKINLLSGLPMEYYPKYKRLFLYLVSFLEAIPFIFLGLGIKVVFLTLKGLIIPGEFFYYEAIGGLKHQDGIFHGAEKFMILLDFLQIVATSKVNSLYKSMCQISTNRENHRTNQSAENSYALKRFCFEFVNRFLHLAYIAYVKVDFSLLTRELTVIFVMDEIRRVVLESILPLILKKMSRRRVASRVLALEKKDIEFNQYFTEKIMELDLPDYDNFDDYLEIIIQFCYLTLFAVVFPQASYLSFFFNIIEYLSDYFKLTNNLYKRPLPAKANSIGCWIWLLNVFSFACVFSNTFFFAFHCHNYYHNNNVTRELEKEQEVELTKAVWVNIFLIVFVTEHLLLSLLLILRYLIKDRPKWVRLFLKRQERKKNVDNAPQD